MATEELLVENKLDEYSCNSDDEVEIVKPGVCTMCTRQCEVAKLSSGRVWCRTCIEVFVSCSSCVSRFLRSSIWEDRPWTATEEKFHTIFKAWRIKNDVNAVEMFKYKYKGWFTWDKFPEAKQQKIEKWLTEYRVLVIGLNP